APLRDLRDGVSLEIVVELAAAHHGLLASKLAKKASTIHGAIHPEATMAEREVWRFKTRTSPSGKRIWPSELKRKATRHLREDGKSPGDVAAALDAHEWLVKKWWVADRRELGEKISVDRPPSRRCQLTCLSLRRRPQPSPQLMAQQAPLICTRAGSASSFLCSSTKQTF
ncbi:hypothetical protein JMM63_21200, partial [Rhodovulum sulfidophilum]|uniref:hypothetical protein n=1 Tax=Rhodovulum sulfidophilum TaxID=35806 RepID=UPI001921E93B